MRRRLAALTWGLTLALVVAGAAAVYAVYRTGASLPWVTAGVAFLCYLSYVSWRSGGRFEFEARDARPLGPRDPPAVRRAVLDVCERAGRPVPRVVAVRMDVPGAMVGYDDGDPVLGIDPRVLVVVGPEGLRALLAHELGHLGTDIHTDAVRQYLPQVVGFGTFWVVVLTGQSPAVATAGSALYVVLAPLSDRRAVLVRFGLSLGTEAVALAASRYANRIEEYRADADAARLVSAPTLAEALYRLAAVATGDNDEDVAGPVPWDAGRSLAFAVFATHPSIESRVRALGCDLPDWVRPYRPRTDASGGGEDRV